MFRIFLIVAISISAQSSWSKPVVGHLSPKEAGDGPALTDWAETYERSSTFGAGAFTDLLDFILPAPNQDDAGSCLYMATTGNVEWWLNRLSKKRNPVHDGSTDLSERHLMYLSNTPVADQLSNTLTDSVYLFNLNRQKAVLNRSYRFAKGWVKYEDGLYKKASPNERGAEYSTLYNWIIEAPKPTAATVRLPKFEREVIYKDPNDNKWAINTMPENIVEKIKSKLRSRNAPVIVVYNHMLIWHAVMIVGYDDQESTENCKFTNKFVDYTKTLADEATQNGETSKAKFLLAQGKAVSQAQEADGGCQEKGVFLIRDSIYDWPDGPTYDYDPSQTGDEAAYSMPVVKKEYQWLKRFGNHAIQIYVK